MASTDPALPSITLRPPKFPTRERSVVEEIDRRQREDLSERRQRLINSTSCSSFDAAPLSPTPLSPGPSLPVIVRSTSHGRGLAQLGSLRTSSTSRYEPVIAVARQCSTDSSSSASSAARKFSFDVVVDAAAADDHAQVVDAARVNSWVETSGFPGKHAEKASAQRVSLGALGVPLKVIDENAVTDDKAVNDAAVERSCGEDESSEDAFYLASEDVVPDEAYCSIVDSSSLGSEEKGLRRSTGTLSHSESEEDGMKDIGRKTEVGRVDGELLERDETNGDKRIGESGIIKQDERHGNADVLITDARTDAENEREVVDEDELSASSEEAVDSSEIKDEEATLHESATLFKCDDPFDAGNGKKEIPLAELVDLSIDGEHSAPRQIKIPDQDENNNEWKGDDLATLMTPLATVLDGDGEDGKEEEGSTQVLTLELDKGVTGLGFCIQGGLDLGEGITPITIKRLFNGETDAQRLLRAGDELLAVGESDLRGVSHAHAWSTLKALPSGRVKLTIRRSI